MNDIPPAAPIPRVAARIYPIGVKDGPAVLIAICTDGSLWELDRRTGYLGIWERLPQIPEFDEVDEPL